VGVVALKAYIELYLKGGRRAFVDIGSIRAIFTGDGHDRTSIAPPEHPLTIVLDNGTEFESYGISVQTIMEQLQMHGRIAGCLYLPT
jgi:hypothetical protein